MKQQNQPIRIGLFGHYGDSNLGDEAIVTAAIQNLCERIPYAEMVGLSMNPGDTQERYRIDSFPIRFSGRERASQYSEGLTEQSDKIDSIRHSLRSRLKNFVPKRFRNSQSLSGFMYLVSNMGSELRFLRDVKGWLNRLDILVVCGSNQLEDSDLGPWGYPYTLFKWGVLAKLTKTRIFFISVGAGPLSHQLSVWMLKQSLSRADYLSYRDSGSSALIAKRIPGIEGPVYPDLAHSLRLAPSSRNGHNIEKTIAINPMPVFKQSYWYEDDPYKYEAYLDRLAALAVHIIGKGFNVKLFNSHSSDLVVMEELMARLKTMPGSDPSRIDMIHNQSVQDIVDTIDRAEIIVGTRFHVTVLPLRLGKPVLGICYQRKSKELLGDVGLEAYSVDINAFTSDELCDKFDKLVENLDLVNRDVATRYERYVDLMDEQWDRLAHMILVDAAE